MDGLVALHLIALGLWGGVVAVEIVFEAGGLLGTFPADAVAWLHRQTDRFLEIPLLVAVVTTGGLLWQRSGWSGEIMPKVLVGLGAVAANVVCVFFVERRAAARGAIPAHTRSVIATALPGFPFAAVALFLGGVRAGWW